MFPNNKRAFFLCISTLSSFLYYYFVYETERSSFISLLFFWTILFAGYYVLNKQYYSFKSLAVLGILFRLVLLFALPNLSQDFYRFIWDGRMIYEGLNPYIHLPEDLIQNIFPPVEQAEELYLGMGKLNGSHYTNYPPLNQFCFFIAALFSNTSIIGAVIVMRVQIILADIGILYFGSKLLKNLKLDERKIFWYFLNPFIIIELTGNLHFESVMLFFLVVFLYLFQQKKWVASAFMLAFSISIKLIPFLFLPIFIKRFLIKKGILKWQNLEKLFLFYTITISTTFILFLPFLSNSLIENYSNSVGLWFKNFEFNASFYYLFREIGYSFRGYNEIAIIGKILPVLTALFVLWISLYRRNKTIQEISTSMLLALSFYFFFSTTVHPWYVASLVLLTVFTKYYYPIIWSFVILLSYQAYANIPWKENLVIVAIEYLIVFAFLLYEIKKPTQKLSGKNCYEKEKESGL